MIAFYIIILPVAVYMLLIWYFTYGYLKPTVRKSLSSQSDSHTGISVVIAARNEEDNLPLLLERLNNQTVDRDFFEVIVVDDYSTDSTFETAVAVTKYYSFRIIRLGEIQAAGGKKSAVSEGIRTGRFPIILVTDADCLPEDDWISLHRKHFADTGCQFAAGLVKIIDSCRGFSAIEALDFYGLTGASAGASGVGLPFICNAANMAFTREGYEAVGGMSAHKHLSSGDDVMLLHQFIRKYGATGVSWINDRGAVVNTRGASSLKAFFSQRIRWASKSKKYRNPVAKLVALVVIMANLSLLTSLVLSLFGLFNAQSTVFLFAMKGVVDFPLLFLVTRKFRQECLLWWFIPSAFLYPVYTSITGLASLYLKPIWKGRRIRL